MKNKRARKAGPGKTLPRLADTYKRYISELTLRRAVARGDLHVVKFAGLSIVTPREEQRFCTLLEIPVAEDATTTAGNA